MGQILQALILAELLNTSPPLDTMHACRMDQTSLGILATFPEIYLPTLSATALLSQSSKPRTTASVHLPPLAFAYFPIGRAHGESITFTRTNLSSEHLQLLLPNIPPGGAIAVVVDLDGTDGYVDEEQSPRLMLTVDGHGAAVYPLDNVWPWLEAVWYPTAESFDTNLTVDGPMGAQKNAGGGRATELR